MREPRRQGQRAPQPSQTGGVNEERAQQASHTAPSSGWTMAPPQAAQGGAKIRASARLTTVRSVTGDAARDQAPACPRRWRSAWRCPTGARDRRTCGPKARRRARRSRSSRAVPTRRCAYPSTYDGREPCALSACSTASAIACTCREFAPVAITKKSVNASLLRKSRTTISRALRPEAASSAVWMDFGSLGRRVAAVLAAVLAAVFVVLAVFVAVFVRELGEGYGSCNTGSRATASSRGARRGVRHTGDGRRCSVRPGRAPGRRQARRPRRAADLGGRHVGRGRRGSGKSRAMTPRRASIGGRLASRTMRGRPGRGGAHRRWSNDVPGRAMTTKCASSSTSG